MSIPILLPIKIALIAIALVFAFNYLRTPVNKTVQGASDFLEKFNLLTEADAQEEYVIDGKNPAVDDVDKLLQEYGTNTKDFKDTNPEIYKQILDSYSDHYTTEENPMGTVNGQTYEEYLEEGLGYIPPAPKTDFEKFTEATGDTGFWQSFLNILSGRQPLIPLAGAEEEPAIPDIEIYTPSPSYDRQPYEEITSNYDYNNGNSNGLVSNTYSEISETRNRELQERQQAKTQTQSQTQVIQSESQSKVVYPARGFSSAAITFDDDGYATARFENTNSYVSQNKAPARKSYLQNIRDDDPLANARRIQNANIQSQIKALDIKNKRQSSTRTNSPSKATSTDKKREADRASSFAKSYYGNSLGVSNF